MATRIAIAQLDPTVGAFEANTRKIKDAYSRACADQARLLLTPELGLCGYPPHDLIERSEMFERNEEALEVLKKLTIGQNCVLAVGHIARNPGSTGRFAQNVVTLLQDGKEVFRQAKTLLPTYDVFDEARYFEPAKEIKLWDCDGIRIGVAICEDLWAHDPAFGRRLYGKDPVESYLEEKVDLILSLSASPYEWKKQARRERLHSEICGKLNAPLIYLNQVGATDEILFDGASFALDQQGNLVGRLPAFRPGYGVIEFSKGKKPEFIIPGKDEREDHSPEDIEVLARGLVLGIKDYFSKTGFKKAVLGLSGGIDSAVVAVLAAQALGRENLLGVAMPSQYSSSHSLEDAEALAKNLGIRFEVRPIKFMYSTLSREISEKRGQLNSIALENLQSRLRGNLLMTLSNHDSALVLTTGNKSELATGYCTLYGDMVGALAPLGDVLKTRVYELAKYMNKKWGNSIPDRSITKPPSAELRPNQTDQDTLPSYDHLDALIEEYIERGTSLTELKTKPQFEELRKKINIQEILTRIELNEYKRRQAAPVLKISPKAFGIGRRIPIAKTWDHFT